MLEGDRGARSPRLARRRGARRQRGGAAAAAAAAAMGNAGSVDSQQTEFRAHSVPLKLPMPEPGELEERFAVVLVSTGPHCLWGEERVGSGRPRAFRGGGPRRSCRGSPRLARGCVWGGGRLGAGEKLREGDGSLPPPSQRRRSPQPRPGAGGTGGLGGAVPPATSRPGRGQSVCAGCGSLSLEPPPPPLKSRLPPSRGGSPSPGRVLVPPRGRTCEESGGGGREKPAAVRWRYRPVGGEGAGGPVEGTGGRGGDLVGPRFGLAASKEPGRERGPRPSVGCGAVGPSAPISLRDTPVLPTPRPRHACVRFSRGWLWAAGVSVGLCVFFFHSFPPPPPSSATDSAFGIAFPGELPREGLCFPWCRMGAFGANVPFSFGCLSRASRLSRPTYSSTSCLLLVNVYVKSRSWGRRTNKTHVRAVPCVPRNAM